MSIGTHPTQGLIDNAVIIFGDRAAVKLYYDRELSKQEIYKFELTPHYDDEILGVEIEMIKGVKFKVIKVDADENDILLYYKALNKPPKMKSFSFREFWKKINNIDE